MCHLDGINHSAEELSGNMSQQYNIGSAQTSSRYDPSPSQDNYSSSRQYGG
ncbi:MAG: hypothetical protein AABW82_00545 [Nanoarchaeota archaeon]